MENAAQMAARSVPFFLETGQNLIWQLSRDARLQSGSPRQVQQVLAEDLRSIPYFTQLYFFDESGESVSGVPEEGLAKIPLSEEEQAGIGYALSGVVFQSFSVQPEEGSPAALISFVVVVQDDAGTVRGALVGRTDLATNPAAQPLLTSLRSMEQVGGRGILLDENNRILFHPDADRILQVYDGGTGEGTNFFSEAGPDRGQQLVYRQSTIGRPWSVVLNAPARYAQQLALSIAAPLMGMVILLSLFAIAIIRLGVGVITASMKNLAVEAKRMAQGELDRPLKIEGEDEPGQLRRAFELLRVRLKNRLDELNRLLVVSQGVASTLEIEGAIKAVLESALATGASSARVVLVPALLPELDGGNQLPQRFGAGPFEEQYSSLDDQILGLNRGQPRLLLTNLTRPRLLAISPGMQLPEALLAVAMRHENMFLGSLWVGFGQPHQFTDEEVRYLSTLAGQAAMAIANARLFLTAEIGRQRLEAILASTPDPVLVTDHQNQLSLINPAASQVFGVSLEECKGQPIEQVIPEGRLVELLRSMDNETQSAEITLPDGQIYLATASIVFADGRRVGRVCVLRDVTHFKELDSLKSEFVSTVSHDLRSPLTLIRGYSSMLQMVGELDEQQNSYLQKIISGVESMSRLVNNLLDLSRIEAGVGLQLEKLPAQEIIQRVVGDLQLQAAQKRIQLSTVLPPDAGQLLEADHDLLQQALQNLVENAIKYTEAGGKVSVQLAIKDDQTIYEVRDDGIGIAPADQHRLFEKFFRAARKGMKPERGSGLGLAIVKSIVERHGGQVWLESQLGKGSSFYMLIPMRQQRG
jgi:PAS domain S-box-containing protein